MKKLILLGVVFVMLLSACDPDDGPIIYPAQPADYFPLAIGNYWVYNNYHIDSNGVETLRPEIDSIVVDRDTLIRGNTYYVIEGLEDPFSWRIINILRDSSNYIVDNTGRIVFSNTDFTNSLFTYHEINGSDTLATWNWFMEKLNSVVSVDAGSFDSIYDYKAIITSNYPSFPSTFPTVHNYYAPNVGKILKNYYFIMSSQTKKDYYEKRLIRYHIE